MRRGMLGCVGLAMLVLALCVGTAANAQGGDPPTLTPAPSLTPTPEATPARTPLRPEVTPFDGSLILENPLLWGLARRMLAGLGVANIRDYLAVVFALMGIARFIAKPPVGRE